MKNLPIVLAVLLFVSSGCGGGASFQGLGDIPGGGSHQTSRAEGVSADGSVAVGIILNPSVGTRAFRWTAACGMINIGEFPGRNNIIAARAVSADGSVLAGSGSSLSGHEAYRWTHSRGFFGLGDLPGDPFLSAANDISAGGDVIVGRGNNPSGQEAIRWTQAGGMVGLGDLPGGPHSSEALGTSADGSTVVGYGSVPSGEDCFVWTQAGGMVSIGDLPGGINQCWAFAVSADGSVVVGFGTGVGHPGGPPEVHPGREAFRWTQSGGIMGLGDLPGGHFVSTARSTTADGSIIVGSSGTGVEEVIGFGGTPTGIFDDVLEAFIWDEANGMQLLSHVLTTEYGLDLSGWTLTEALEITDNGQAIVGRGINPDGLQEGWIAHLSTD